LEKDNRDPKYKAITMAYKYVLVRGDPSTELKGEPQVYLNTRQVEVHTHLVLSCTGIRLEKPVPVKRK